MINGNPLDLPNYVVIHGRVRGRVEACSRVHNGAWSHTGQAGQEMWRRVGERVWRIAHARVWTRFGGEDGANVFWS